MSDLEAILKKNLDMIRILKEAVEMLNTQVTVLNLRVCHLEGLQGKANAPQT